MVLDTLKENETVVWAVDKFIKVGLGSFLVFSIVLIMKEIVGFTFDISASLGI